MLVGCSTTSVCRAVCRNFAKGGGGANLGYFKKRGEAQLQAASGEALETMLKIGLVILRDL